jgi:hypothetical protein
MPIKQAGPFASSSDSYLDKPDNAIESVIPVNCAKDNKEFWPFRIYSQKFEGSGVQREYTANTNQSANGVPFLNPELDLAVVSANLVCRFSYQAMQSFSFAEGSKIEIEYGDGELTIWSASVSGSTVPLNEEAEEESAGTQEFNLSGFVFPASVVPRIVDIRCSTISLLAGSSTVGLLARVRIALVLTPPS